MYFFINVFGQMVDIFFAGKWLVSDCEVGGQLGRPRQSLSHQTALGNLQDDQHFSSRKIWRKKTNFNKIFNTINKNKTNHTKNCIQSLSNQTAFGNLQDDQHFLSRKMYKRKTSFQNITR